MKVDENIDIWIKGGTILTMTENGVFQGGHVLIKDGKIHFVGKELPCVIHAANIIEATGCLVLPGLVNCHTHAPMTLFRGLADDLPLMTWLKDYIFPVEARMDKEFVYVGALLGIAEMLLSGTTTFCDMYLFEESVARAAKDAGIRCVVGEVLYDFPSPNYGPLEKGLEYTQWLLSSYEGDPLIKVAVEPHATFTCSPSLLIKAYELAQTYNAPYIIHVAETKTEVRDTLEKYGKRPVELLGSLGLLGQNTVAVHCVHLSDGEIESLRDTGTKVVFNPESNMKLASGIPRVREIVDQGIICGIGTDGAASNNNLDLLEEMDTLAKLTKVRYQDPACISAMDVLKMGTIGGTKALGMDELIGGIEPGKRADVIVIDGYQPHLIPSFDPFSTLIYSAKGSDVRDVVVDGKILVRERQLLTIDWLGLKKEAEKMAIRVKEWTSQ